MLHESMPTGVSALSPRSLFKPVSVAILCYPGAARLDIALPFHMLAGLSQDEHSVCEVALVGVTDRELRLADGAMIWPDHALHTQCPAFDVLVVPCGFFHSEAFAAPGAVAPLIATIKEAKHVLLIAPTLQLARRVQMLLGPASTWSTGAFWEAVRPMHDPLATRFIEDGHLTWAIGPSAPQAGIGRLVRKVPALRGAAMARTRRHHPVQRSETAT
jgi:DJ-1/PfpI family